MKTFRRTLCMHGYAGSPEGSIRGLMDELIAQLGLAPFGELIFPDLPFSRHQGAAFGDSPQEMLARVHRALAQDWDLRDTLCIGFSMGGFLPALLAQRQGAGTVVALSSPDHLNEALALDPALPLEVLAAYSTQDDEVIRGRMDRWPSLTPFAYDIPGLTHEHDNHRAVFLRLVSGFLEGLPPGELATRL
nr:hypothetical protein [uncultured Holophaga sp.]